MVLHELDFYNALYRLKVRVSEQASHERVGAVYEAADGSKMFAGTEQEQPVPLATLLPYVEHYDMICKA